MEWGSKYNINTTYIRKVFRCIIGGFYEAFFSTTSSKAHEVSKTSCAVQIYEFNWWSSWTSKFADDLVNGQSRFWNILWSGQEEWSWGLDLWLWRLASSPPPLFRVDCTEKALKSRSCGTDENIWNRMLDVVSRAHINTLTDMITQLWRSERESRKGTILLWI